MHCFSPITWAELAKFLVDKVNENGCARLEFRKRCRLTSPGRSDFSGFSLYKIVIFLFTKKRACVNPASENLFFVKFQRCRSTHCNISK